MPEKPQPIVDAVNAITEEGGPEAAVTMLMLMLSNAESQAWTFEQIAESHERDAKEWRERALAAEARIHAAQDRLLALFDPPYESEGIA